jgi:transposase
MLGLGAELGRDQVHSPRARAVTDGIARDDEIGTVICDAAYRGMRVSVFPWAMPTPSLVPRSLSI